jgi:hypothetical protein
MTIKRFFDFVVGSVVLLAVAAVAVSLLRSANQGKYAACIERRNTSYRLADELRQSSDDLTRFSRLYVATGQATPGVQIRLPETTAWVREVDLMEDPITELAATQGVVELDLKPFEIRTLQFPVPPLGVGQDA